MDKVKQRLRRETAIAQLEAKMPLLVRVVESIEARNLRDDDIEYGFLLEARRTLKRAREALARTKENIKENCQ